MHIVPIAKGKESKVQGIPDELKDLFQSEEDLQRILMRNQEKKRLKEKAKQQEKLTIISDPFHKTLEDEHYKPGQ